MRTYNLGNLLNDTDPSLRFIAGYTEADRAAERLALACDARIPAGSIGYVEQLASPAATRAVQLDAARMLARFVEFYQAIPAV